jgi:hypothetical protein
MDYRRYFFVVWHNYPIWFMVPMLSKDRKGAFREPESQYEGNRVFRRTLFSAGQDARLHGRQDACHYNGNS